MMNADLAIVTARLPYVDRGVLSQAWYDALHLERLHAVNPSQRDTARGTSYDLSQRHMRVGSSSGDAGRTGTAALPCSSAKSTMPAPGLVLHQAIRTQRTCAKLGRAWPVNASSISQKIAQQSAAMVQLPDGQRLCLLIREQGSHVQLIVLCAQPLQARVARALERVRLLLAERGLSYDMYIHGRTV